MRLEGRSMIGILGRASGSRGSGGGRQGQLMLGQVGSNF